MTDSLLYLAHKTKKTIAPEKTGVNKQIRKGEYDHDRRNEEYQC